MLNTTFNTRIQNKRDTASNWENYNPVLLAGELIVVDTENGSVKTKIGDGVRTYSQLPFQEAQIESGGESTYELPVASKDTLGGVKIGTNISISNGTISVADASTTAKGIVKLDNDETASSTSTAPTSAALQRVSSKVNDMLPKSGGTLTGDLVAAGTAIQTASVRNIYAGTQDLVAGTTPLATGTIYIVYE